MVIFIDLSVSCFSIKALSLFTNYLKVCPLIYVCLETLLLPSGLTQLSYFVKATKNR